MSFSSRCATLSNRRVGRRLGRLQPNPPFRSAWKTPQFCSLLGVKHRGAVSFARFTKCGFHVAIAQVQSHGFPSRRKFSICGGSRPGVRRFLKKSQGKVVRRFLLSSISLRAFCCCSANSPGGMKSRSLLLKSMRSTLCSPKKASIDIRCMRQ